MEDFVQVCVPDDLHPWPDVMLVTEVHDPLSVGHSSQSGATEGETLHQELDLADRVRLESQTYLNTDSHGVLHHPGEHHQSEVWGQTVSYQEGEIGGDVVVP